MLRVLVAPLFLFLLAPVILVFPLSLSADSFLAWPPSGWSPPLWSSPASCSRAGKPCSRC